MACHNVPGTRVSIVVVMAADHAREQGKQQEPDKVGNTLLGIAL
jgi:hypothetical protein